MFACVNVCACARFGSRSVAFECAHECVSRPLTVQRRDEIARRKLAARDADSRWRGRRAPRRRRDKGKRDREVAIVGLEFALRTHAQSHVGAHSRGSNTEFRIGGKHTQCIRQTQKRARTHTRTHTHKHTHTSNAIHRLMHTSPHHMQQGR
jgi:hypothetical protein